MEARFRAAERALGLRGLAAAGHQGVPGAIYGFRGTGKIASTSATDAAKKFLAAMRPVLGLSAADLDTLETEERASVLPQRREVIVRRKIGKLPLFGARLRIHLGTDGEFTAAVGNLYGNLSAPASFRIDARAAGERAALTVGRLERAPVEGRAAAVDPGRVTAVAYPLGDVARPAWLVGSVRASNGVDSFEVVVDAVDGTVLEVVPRTFYGQGQVFVDASAMPQSPQPTATPGVVPPTPNPPSYVSRTTVPLTVSGTTLSGNNTHVREYQAWNGYGLSSATGNAISAPGGDFTFPLTLGSNTDVRLYPQAAGTNLYGILEYAHDYFYGLGFDEAHGNFQVDNFGRGGSGGDPVLAFTQLGARAPGQWAYEHSNAWMETGADGASPVMGMYVWRPGAGSPVVYRTDSSLDPDIALHEFTHGVTDRLTLGGLYYWRQSGAIHEGNSDFFALNVQVPSTAPADGSFPVGGYSEEDFTRGIRTYPYSTSLAVNPLTYADFGQVWTWGPEVHADGEIWATALWEMRGALIGSLGFETGRTRAAQLVIDALQLLPPDPTFVDFRNAMVAADEIRYGGAHHDELWAAFARRGLGALASGGMNAYSLYVLADETMPSTGAHVRLWESATYPGETVRIVVSDENANAATATLTTSGGDTETVTLSGAAPAFHGSIATRSRTPVPGDGVLQVTAGDEITATTTDSDDGGQTAALTASASVSRAYSVIPLGGSEFDAAMATELLFSSDETTFLVELPFPFTFFGTSYAKIYVNDNGFVSFAPPDGIRVRGLSSPGMGRVVAPFSVDLDCRYGGGVFLHASSERFTVRWGCAEFNARENAVNVAVTFYPTGQIRFDYGPGNELTGVDYYGGAPKVATVGLSRYPETYSFPVDGYDGQKDLGLARSLLFSPFLTSTATVSGGGIICGSESATISADLTGTAPWSLTWSDGVTQSAIVESPVTRTVAPAVTTTYTLTAISDAEGPGIATGEASVTVESEAAIARPSYVCAGAAANVAAVRSFGAGATYAWSITNGTINVGSGTRSITFTAGASGNVGLMVVVTADGCTFEGEVLIPTQNCGGTVPQYVITHFAGTDGGPGWFDGEGAEARFKVPAAAAADDSGNIYVADAANHTIRKVTRYGEVTTLAGLAGVAGSADGPGAAARFNEPSAVAIDGSGNVFVADSMNHTIRRITPRGVVSTIAGQAGTMGSIDGFGDAARFSNPRGVTLDPAGNLFIADGWNYTIRRVDPDGEVTTFAGAAGEYGYADGTGNAARFVSVQGLVLDTEGNLFVADQSSIRKITPDGAVTTFAGQGGQFGSVDGTGTAARFGFLGGLTIDAGGDLFVTDTYFDRIRKVTPAAVVSTPSLTWMEDGASGFAAPGGITALDDGDLVVADSGNDAVRLIAGGLSVTTLAGRAAEPGFIDGPGVDSRFFGPAGVALDSSGNVYVVDRLNASVRRITPDGMVDTIAGSGSPGSDDGVGSTAEFLNPEDLTVNGNGEIYVADTHNHALRKVTRSGAVNTMAGLAGTSGSADGTGTDARFSFPTGIATLDGETLCLTDLDNHTVRLVTPEGAVTTIAGQAGSSGSTDGTGSDARFAKPFDLTVDGAGTIYVADFLSSTIRKIDAGHVVTTLAGEAGSPGAEDGTGGAARFRNPTGVASDAAGNVFVAD